MPQREVEYWPLMALQTTLMKIGAKVMRYGHCVTFQMAQVAVPRNQFAVILCRIDRLRRKPAAT